MKTVLGRLLLAFLPLFVWSQPSHAFMVTLDVMALPAANHVASAVESTSATKVASANKNSAEQVATATKNSEKEVATANTNTAKSIVEAAKNAKDIMDQALFFAKYPSEWVELSKKYANVGSGWTSGMSTKESVKQALIEFDKYRITNAAGDGTVTSLAGAYARELEKYKNQNSPYLQTLSSKTDTAAAYAKLLNDYKEQVDQRQQRMVILSDMLNAATLQREITAIGTLISMEQEIGASQRTAYEISRDMIRTNAESTESAPVMQRMAEFTDTRNAAPSAGLLTKSASSLQRISFKN